MVVRRALGCSGRGARSCSGGRGVRGAQVRCEDAVIGARGVETAATAHGARIRQWSMLGEDAVFLIFFCLVKIATPPGEEPLVMVHPNIVDTNPTAGQTGSDATFKLVVNGSVE